MASNERPVVKTLRFPLRVESLQMVAKVQALVHKGQVVVFLEDCYRFVRGCADDNMVRLPKTWLNPPAAEWAALLQSKPELKDNVAARTQPLEKVLGHGMSRHMVVCTPEQLWWRLQWYAVRPQTFIKDRVLCQVWAEAIASGMFASGLHALFWEELEAQLPKQQVQELQEQGVRMHRLREELFCRHPQSLKKGWLFCNKVGFKAPQAAPWELQGA